ncbi:hypothetical protein KM043_004514 [Ampulex compressa]|nr:hypothetical protein KM043_004514 [Ampulex compressa]
MRHYNRPPVVGPQVYPEALGPESGGNEGAPRSSLSEALIGQRVDRPFPGEGRPLAEDWHAATTNDPKGG